MPIILLADSGSTKTEWCLLRPDQTPLTLRTDGINPYFQATDQIIATLHNQLLPGLNGVAPNEVFFYGTGCNSPTSNTKMAQAIQSALPHTQFIDVQSDMLGAARGAAGGQPAVVCILGTGANAATYDGKGLTSPSYSLGFWLGDEGSGGNLGKRLVTAFLHNQLPHTLAEDFSHQYAIDRLTVLDHAYNQPYPNRYFAQFTRFLSAHRNDPFVQQLLQQSFTEFLTLYVKRLPQPDKYPVHVVGSIGFYFEEEVKRVMTAQHLTPGQFLQTPMLGLVQYHSAT
ncbi:N-acetylglucosamine kinase [Fibrella sp. HMF5335]|uniref:N-acetylglucosamine kinase n=1 Tax=Fibrella rubiginis TaxID=2817060 RepID=A0A939GFK4_9BACT|nr:N-acetylglucosamine kinase [Fibrella rubiginis]MBO0938232.1 N-acetylglucosamine kinase [Fibrella rubiginis]